MTKSATATRGDDDDDATYAKYATLEPLTAFQMYPPRFFASHDSIWSLGRARRALFTPMYKSELQEDTALSNAGVWTEYALLSADLAYDIATESGLTDGPVRQLLDITRKYMDTAHDSLRTRRDYLEYRHHDWSAADQLERMTAADRSTHKMMPGSRKNPKLITTNVVEAKTKTLAQGRASGNVGNGSNGNKGGRDRGKGGGGGTQGNKNNNKGSGNVGKQPPGLLLKNLDSSTHKGIPKGSGRAGEGNYI